MKLLALLAFVALLCFFTTEARFNHDQIFSVSWGKADATDKVSSRFQGWLGRFRFFSSPEDRERRFDIFRQNLNHIRAYNQASLSATSPGAVLSSDGPHAGMTYEEFLAKRTGYRPPPAPKKHKRFVEDVDSAEQSRKTPPKKSPSPKKPTVKKPTVKKPAQKSTTRAPPTPPPTRVPPQPAPKPPPSFSSPAMAKATLDPNFEIVDWRNKCAPITDQKQCGGCWAFATVAVLEAQLAIKNNAAPKKLSEQFLIDCDRHGPGNQFPNSGCSGGGFDYAARWLAKNPMPTAEDYPYVGSDQQCRVIDPSRAVSNVKGTNYVSTERLTPEQRVKAMEDYLRNYGPIAATVDASQVWMHYKNGIIRSTDCSQYVGHFIAIVGFGTVQGVPVWIVRNSWSTAWGIDGYAFLERGPEGACGVLHRTFSYNLGA